MVPDDVARFGSDVVAHLEALLRADFVGAYFVGSIALGGYVPGETMLTSSRCQHITSPRT